MLRGDKDGYGFAGLDCVNETEAKKLSEGIWADNPQKTRLTCVEEAVTGEPAEPQA